MKLPDVNVLLYAANEAAAEHDEARTWLEAAFDGPEGVGFAWVSLLGFMRLATRRGIFPNPLSVEDALAVVQTWLAHEHAMVLHPSDRHLAILGRLLVGARTAGNLTTDAHVAALAIENGATVGSFDRDFERFSGLRLELLG
ncbi:MAG TPA: TA system VapC family ribonuclease toxin [Burkholderiales bacterium]|nr:TA system VapC family ribonuclease toxin [Burkholderiales bacterium]